MKKLKVNFNNIIEKHIYSNKVFLGESKANNDLKNYISNNLNFDCFFKVKKDNYSNKTVIHLEDIH